MSSDGSVLYVGKAKNLAKRISQYRQGRENAPNKELLLREASQVRFQILASELEALLVEAELIRRYQPRFNILLRDDKSPIYVIVTRDEYPRVLTARKREIERKKISGDVYGPFQSAYMLNKVLRTIRPIFRWCNKRSAKKGGDGKPCFYYHLDMCSGACVDGISSQEYRANISRLRRFLRGNTSLVLRQLKKEIEDKAKAQDFESAQQLRQQYEAIQTVTDPAYRLEPDVALPRLRSAFGTQALSLLREVLRRDLNLDDNWSPNRIECYDVSNLQGKLATVSMVVFSQGVSDPSQYRIFHVRRHETPDDYAMLRQVLKRRQNHSEWGVPDLVLIDGGRGQLSAAQSVWQWPTPVVSIAKRPDRLITNLPGGKGYVQHLISELSVAGELLQQLRDEAHRFAKKHVHKRLAKRDLER